jgi:hypothetical protein
MMWSLGTSWADKRGTGNGRRGRGHSILHHSLSIGDSFNETIIWLSTNLTQSARTTRTLLKHWSLLFLPLSLTDHAVILRAIDSERKYLSCTHLDHLFIMLQVSLSSIRKIPRLEVFTKIFRSPAGTHQPVKSIIFPFTRLEIRVQSPMTLAIFRLEHGRLAQ